LASAAQMVDIIDASVDDILKIVKRIMRLNAD
jgi:hypothetical protein